MPNLEQQIRASAEKLKQAWTAVQASNSDVLMSTCAQKWTDRTSYFYVLDGTADLLALRADAWSRLDYMVQACIGGTGDRVQMDNSELSFNAARHFALVSYQATTWSIYDRLANVCGRISGITKVDSNPRQNPKLCDGLLAKETLGFGISSILRQAYDWPIRVSYKVRNWLVHEGYEEGTTVLFAGDDLNAGFTLHADAVVYLEACCQRSDGGNDHLISIPLEDDKWPTRDLVAILVQYNQQVDRMFCSFLKWTVDSLCNQIRDFTIPYSSS